MKSHPNTSNSSSPRSHRPSHERPSNTTKTASRMASKTDPKTTHKATSKANPKTNNRNATDKHDHSPTKIPKKTGQPKKFHPHPNNTKQEEAISFTNISFKYPSAPANTLTNVTFTINKGESVVIIGPNGGGKTTCLLLLIGQLKPQIGQIRLFGTAISKTRSLINGVFQKNTLDHPSFPILLKDFVALGALELKHHARTSRALACLASVGLEPLRNHNIATLSAGQRQRMFIARALVNDAPILLFDEPTANLDESSESLFYDILKKLRAQRKTIILISHDISVAPHFSDKIFCLNNHLHEIAHHHLDEASLKHVYAPELNLLGHSHYTPRK